MLDALVAGETDPNVLAELARRQMRNKIPALRDALAGHFDAHHRLWVGASLRHIDFLDERIEQLSTGCRVCHRRDRHGHVMFCQRAALGVMGWPLSGQR